MSSKNRSCPECNAAMDFRLGQFDCPSCGHTELAAQPKQERKSSGPGFQSQQQWGSSSGRPSTPPGVAPPPASGTVYSQDVNHSFGRGESTQPKYHSSLQTEKHVYFGLAVVGSLISAAGGASEVSGGAAMGFAGGLLSSVIGMFILAYVLYGSELWPKQCCMGCTGIQMLGYLGSLFFVNSMMNDMDASGGLGVDLLAGGFAVFFILIVVAVNAWLIWILYRDCQYLS